MFGGDVSLSFPSDDYHTQILFDFGLVFYNVPTV